MQTNAIPVCRHRGEATAPGVHRCESPKLAGLKLVTAAMCNGCVYRDHEPILSLPVVGRLHPCASRGSERLPESAVYQCFDARHSWTTDAQCQTCPDYLFPVVTPRTPPADVRRLGALPHRPQPSGWWNWPNVREAFHQATADAAANLPPYPDHYAGRGVVMVGGGRYFVSAYVSLRVLREVGCTLPVQLWHLDGEMTDAMRDILRPYGVECVNGDEVARAKPFRFLNGHWWKGWQLKPYAIFHSPFEEVLYLDADNYPIRNPEALLDDERYRDHGSLFWPDGGYGDGADDRWEVFGVKRREGMSFESGQILLDKRRCWRELSLALWYNSQADFVYRIIYGDKDTFYFAWRRLNREFGRLWPTCEGAIHGITQLDEQGRPLFIHRCRDKWRFKPEAFDSTIQAFGANHYFPDLPHEDFCIRCLGELKALWPQSPTV